MVLIGEQRQWHREESRGVGWRGGGGGKTGELDSALRIL
jgi:hypothetical protein